MDTPCDWRIAGANRLRTSERQKRTYPLVGGYSLNSKMNKSPTPILDHLQSLALDDPSPQVRLYLASALQRLPLSKRWVIARNLIAHSEDAEDHKPPLDILVWHRTSGSPGHIASIGVCVSIEDSLNQTIHHSKSGPLKMICSRNWWLI